MLCNKYIVIYTATWCVFPWPLFIEAPPSAIHFALICKGALWFVPIHIIMHTHKTYGRAWISALFFCSELRSVTIHLQNYGPTSETLKHGHIRCNDFLIESCFRVHSSKISKQVNKCLFQTQWSICI